MFQLLKCLLSGLFTNCAWSRAGGRYVTSAGAAASLHPSSVLHGRPANPALVYTELLHTQRSFLINVSVVQPQWLQQVAPEYARRCRSNRWRTEPNYRWLVIVDDDGYWRMLKNVFYLICLCYFIHNSYIKLTSKGKVVVF